MREKFNSIYTSIQRKKEKERERNLNDFFTTRTRTQKQERGVRKFSFSSAPPLQTTNEINMRY